MERNSISQQGLTLILLILFTGLSLDCVYSQAFCSKTNALLKAIEKYHYQPKVLDSLYYTIVFDDLMDRIDPNGLYLSSEDILHLEGYMSLPLSETCDLLEKATNLYSNRLHGTEKLLKALKLSDIDFSAKDSITLSLHSNPSVKSELKNQWIKNIRLEFLFKIGTDSILSNEDLKNTFQTIIEDELCLIRSKFNHPEGIKGYVGNRYLKSLSFGFDPHTVFFTEGELAEFEEMLSRETLSFGMEISKNMQGDIQIKEILPGGSAWASNKIDEGDILESIVTPENGEKVLFKCLSVRDVKDYLRSIDSGAQMKFRKKNGERITVHLIKQELKVGDNVIWSFILKDELQVGYIHLPSFYEGGEFGEYVILGSSNDVAREIIRLKRAGIEGLIFDLRNNTGGSVNEALEMAGMFINYGALSMIDSRENEIQVFKDNNRGKIFDGPVVVLIDHMSASASEMFAAVMQDQNRAVIVGGRSFGKSTYQIVIPVEGIDNGFLKITMGKFFRVDGSSHQKKGVIPDIELPVEIEFEGENFFPSALEPSSIDKKAYYFPESPLPVEELKEKSAERVENNDSFGELVKKNKIWNSIRSEIKIPLNTDQFNTFAKEYLLFGNGKKNGSDTTTLEISNPTYMKAILEVDKNWQLANEEFIKEMKSDPIVWESANILFDLIEFKK